MYIHLWLHVVFSWLPPFEHLMNVVLQVFYSKFSTNTNELKFILIKTSAVLYISKEFILVYIFFKVPLPSAAIQASQSETIPLALFDAASLWRPESQGLSHGRATTVKF